MFVKENRFSFRNGVPKNIIKSPFFIVRYDKFAKNGLECAVVVGKKVDKKSTVRNGLKRKIVLRIKKVIKLDKKIRIVIYARNALNEKNFNEAGIVLENLLSSL